MSVISQVAAESLVGLNGLEEGLEVAGAETLMVTSLDDLHKDGGAVLERLCEDLEEVTLIVVVD